MSKKIIYMLHSVMVMLSKNLTIAFFTHPCFDLSFNPTREIKKAAIHSISVFRIISSFPLTDDRGVVRDWFRGGLVHLKQLLTKHDPWQSSS